MIDPESLMRLAIAKARTGLSLGQSPFGCAIARGDQVIAVAHNRVVASTDITAHAEINAIRSACQALGQIHLTGCRVATTCEPCPMCMAALHWARVDEVYFGATIADASQAGFNELRLSARELLDRGGSPVQLISGCCVDECRELFAEWLAQPKRRSY